MHKTEDGCYIIAEAGLNHNGSLEIAKKLIDVAAVAGVDAVKFQKRTVDKLAVKSLLDAADTRFPDFGSTYREIREHLEFNADEYVQLKNYTQSKGLDFFVTAFDTDAVDFLERINVDRYKLASHSLTNLQLLEYLSLIGKPVILSTGMCDMAEIDVAVEIFRRENTPLSLMHCVSSYPTPPEDCNLNMMAVLRDRFNLPTGYSGHEMGYLPSILAACMGAQLIERHFTLDKSLPGFDHRISLEPDELIAMVKDIRAIEKIKGNGSKSVSAIEQVTRDKYHVSMASNGEIKAGAVLSAEMISYRNPGTGIPAKMANLVLGRRAKRDIPDDVLLSEDMFE